MAVKAQASGVIDHPVAKVFQFHANEHVHNHYPKYQSTSRVRSPELMHEITVVNNTFPVNVLLKKENTMSQPIVFISHFKIKKGKLDDVKQLSQNVSEFIKTNKPGTVAFLQYTNEAGTELSIIHVFPDTESFDRHNEGAGERANKAFEFIVPTRREIYGLPSDQAMGILTPHDGSGISLNRTPQIIGGYIRPKAE